MRTRLPFFLGLTLTLSVSGVARADNASKADTKAADTSIPAATGKVSDPAATAVPDRATSGAPIREPPSTSTKPEPAPPSPAATSGAKAASDKKGDEDDSTRETRREMAQAQRMADAALAAQTNSSSTGQELAPVNTSPTAPAACDDDFCAAPSAVPAHHRLREMTKPDLGPDYADPKHHTMGELF